MTAELAKEALEHLTPEQRERVQAFSAWWQDPEGKRFRRYLQTLVWEMQTDWAGAVFYDPDKPDRSALLNAEMLGEVRAYTKLLDISAEAMAEVE